MGEAMQNEGTRFYRVKAVAERYDVSLATIYRAIETGKLDALKIGVALRIPDYALTAFENTAAEAAYADVQAGTVTTTDDEAPVMIDGYGPLNEAQADGRACVVCRADFLATGVSAFPVGHSHTGSQIFACTTHPAGQRRVNLMGA
jgi:excisionase family DNA binding protein